MIKAGLFSFLIFICATGCSVLEEPEELTLINIGADYILKLSQTLQLGPNSLMINVRSTDTPHCENSYIDLTARQVGNNIQLVLGEIIHGDPCIQTDEHLEAQSLFELTPRQYDISISLKHIVQNTGTIDVSSDSFTLNLRSKNGIRLEEPMVKIIPDGYVWGQIYYTEQDHYSTLMTYIADAKQKNNPHNLDEGNYGYFDIKDGMIDLPGSTDYNQLDEVFILKQTETFTELISRFEALSHQFPQFNIQVYNSTGDSYTN